MLKPMRAIAASVLASVLVAGCGEAIFGGCGPHDSLEWVDPDLYRALSGIAHDETPAAPGLLDGAAVGAPGSRLTTVFWTPYREGGLRREASVLTFDGQTISAQAASDAEARSMLESFMVNASAVNDTARDRIVASALAAKTKAMEMYDADRNEPIVIAWTYAADATAGEWRLSELIDEIGGTNASVMFSSPGTARLELGQYSFVVAYPIRSATLDGIPVTVDAAGHARAVPGEREENAAANASVTRVKEVMQASGLPAPDDPRVLTAIC